MVEKVISEQQSENKEIKIMRRLMILGAVVFCILLSVSFSVRADSIGKDVLSGDDKFVGRIELNRIKNRNMKGRDTARLSSEQYLLVGDYVVTDSISLLVKMGLADLEVHRAEGETHFFDGGFAYGAGLNALLFENPEIGYRIDIGFRYFTFEPGKGEVTGIAEHLPYTLPHKVTIDWTEWQAFLAFRKDFELFDLWGGCKYSNVECDQERAGGVTEEITFESEDNFGLFAGIDIEIKPNLSTYFEVRFIDETALTLGMAYGF